MLYDKEYRQTSYSSRENEGKGEHTKRIRRGIEHLLNAYESALLPNLTGGLTHEYTSLLTLPRDPDRAVVPPSLYIHLPPTGSLLFESTNERKLRV